MSKLAAIADVLPHIIAPLWKQWDRQLHRKFSLILQALAEIPMIRDATMPPHESS
jgi:hypothetical protein